MLIPNGQWNRRAAENATYGSNSLVIFVRNTVTGKCLAFMTR